MTFAELRAEVFRRLRESLTAPVYFSVDDVDTAINEGYAELSDATEWNEASLEIDLLEDRPYYDLRTLIGPTFLALKPAFDIQTNRWLIPSIVRQLDAHDRRWERVTGEPQRIFLAGLWWMGLFPNIQSDTGSIKVYHTALPAPLVEDEDEPGFPEAFHSGIVEWALTDLYAQDAETKWALQAWARYLTIEQDLQQWVEDRAAAPLSRGFDSPQSSVQR